jgi:hypothetical protein
VDRHTTWIMRAAPEGVKKRGANAGQPVPGRLP